MAKNTYFGHSFTLANSPGMFYIVSHGGVKAYGQIFMLIEMLGNDNNAIDLKNKPLAYMVAKRLECDVDDLDELVNILVESDLFELINGVLSSKIVSEAYR
ncbi:MAG TPA: DUF4373 domain-containing protein, partial [Candidatus Wallbacteria bacterium]|nr:DUF4373 domain-containing protein [Candidatus Wallbacteria bacterium]